jgi:ribonuclease BN (tRNA processing enzyme)
MEARLLGSGGFVPSDVRETSCVYLREGADVLLLDAGTGLRRLLTEPDLLDGVERLSIALSHFHLDHTIGLFYLAGFESVPEREVWAPGRIVAGVPAEDVVHRLLDPPFLTARPEEVVGGLVTAVHELDGDFRAGPFSVETRIQPRHVGPTIAMRVDGSLAYCTDTAYDGENVAFARGAPLLLHEAHHASETSDDGMHCGSGEAAEIAAAAGVERLVLVHVTPWVDEEELVRIARGHFAGAEIGRDGLTL